MGLPLRLIRGIERPEHRTRRIRVGSAGRAGVDRVAQQPGQGGIVVGGAFSSSVFGMIASGCRNSLTPERREVKGSQCDVTGLAHLIE